tara:strand:- start:2986 stop:3549 length:564 start_codon:yes stop_codon:yes gene_type:complete
MANLTQNFNYLQPTSFKLTIDRKNYPNLEFFCQSFTHPGMIMNAVEVPYQRITGVPFIGDKLTFNEMLANIIVDEDMKAYDEMYSWMRRNLDIEHVSPVQRINNQPPAMADITLSILSSHNNTTKTIKYIDSIPVSLTDVQFESTSGGESFVVFGASFRFSYFEMSGASYTTNVDGTPSITVNRQAI